MVFLGFFFTCSLGEIGYPSTLGKPGGSRQHPSSAKAKGKTEINYSKPHKSLSRRHFYQLYLLWPLFMRMLVRTSSTWIWRMRSPQHILPLAKQPIFSVEVRFLFSSANCHAKNVRGSLTLDIINGRSFSGCRVRIWYQWSPKRPGDYIPLTMANSLGSAFVFFFIARFHVRRYCSKRLQFAGAEIARAVFLYYLFFLFPGMCVYLQSYM